MPEQDPELGAELGPLDWAAPLKPPPTYKFPRSQRQGMRLLLA